MELERPPARSIATVKLLVLGHSDSDGTRLSSYRDAWPYLVQNDLERSLGREVQVVHRLLFAGPSAAAFVERQVAAEAPDAAILCPSTYGVVVQLVSNRINEAFGPRYARMAARAERTAVRTTYRLGPVASKPLVVARAAARRLIGTRPALTFEAMLQSYADCMAVLAKSENLQTVVLGGAGYTRQHQRLNPLLLDLQAAATREFKRLAEHHHFDWLVHEVIMGGIEAKERFYFADGVHTNEESQRLVADAVTPLVLAALA